MNAMLKRVGIICAALIPVAIVGAFVFRSNDDHAVAPASTGTVTPAQGTDTTQTTPAATTTASASSMYKDGTYTADGAYVSPMGNETITVTVTVANDLVTAVSLVPHGTGGSALWQGKFASGLQAAVVGKSLADLKLSKVSGSSLTPIGFNAAVELIKSQAEA